MSFLIQQRTIVNGDEDDPEEEKESNSNKTRQLKLLSNTQLNDLNQTKKQILINDFQTELNHNLIKFRNENLFTDIFIYVEGVEFPCHKVILCASSSYFKAMFSCDLKESRLGKVFIENITSWTMKRLLDFIYTGKIEINYENVIDIFNAAAMFQLYKLADKCTDYIEEHIDLSNCIEIHVFASLHQLVKLEKDTFQFILDNFMQLINSPPSIPVKIQSATNSASILDELNATDQLLNSVNSLKNNDIVYFSDFVLLSETSFQSLIKSDSLNVSREIYVYYAVKKWIEYQMLSQQQQQPTISTSTKLLKTYENLFKHIRLNALSRDELEFILNNDKLVQSNQTILRKFKGFLDFNQSSIDENASATQINIGISQLTLPNPCLNSIRPSTIPREYLCCLQSDRFQFFDFYKSKWDFLSSWPPPPSSTNKANCFSHNFAHLMPQGSTTVARKDTNNLNGYSTCIVNNILYVIGGYEGQFKLVDHMWRFDPIKNEWNNCKPMLRQRAFHLSISLRGTSTCTTQHLTFNTGSSLVTQCLSIDYYSIETDQWSNLNIANNNSLLSHHIFQSINIQNRSIFTSNYQQETELNQLIQHQLAQAKTIVSLKNLIYILKENCINCYEFDSNLEQLICLPYFRLPNNLSSFSLATAFPVKITAACGSLSTTLFSWYSDNEDTVDSLQSSPQVAHCNRNIESSLKASSSSENHLNNETKTDDLSDDNDSQNNDSNCMRNKKEALIYLINVEKKVLYEFYPAKNKLKKLPNLTLKHAANQTFVLSIKSKLYVTGGILENELQKLKSTNLATNHTSEENSLSNSDHQQQQNEELINSNVIEVLNEDKDCWSVLKNNLGSSDNHINQSIQITKHYFKLKMSLV